MAPAADDLLGMRPWSLELQGLLGTAVWAGAVRCGDDRAGLEPPYQVEGPSDYTGRHEDEVGQRDERGGHACRPPQREAGTGTPEPLTVSRCATSTVAVPIRSEYPSRVQ